MSNTPPIIIKKYANRRLYNTDTSSYITLEDLANIVRNDQAFIVQDVKGDDITRSVLTQIILDAESKDGNNLLPEAFLKQLISFYGNQVNQLMFPNFIEQAMESFVHQQKTMESQFKTAFAQIFQNPISGFAPSNLDDIVAQNKKLVENSMKLFNPFMAMAVEKTMQKNISPHQNSQNDDLRAQMQELQKEIAQLKKSQ